MSVSEGVKLPAVVLAGGSTLAAAALRTGAAHRAMVAVEGRPMLLRVTDALAGAKGISSVIVVGNVPPNPNYRSVPDAGSLVDNVYAGLQAAGDAPYAIVATCDTPFITPEVVDDFVARATALGADFVYPIVDVRLCRERFPGIRRTSVRLREGEFTGGNLVLVNPRAMALQRERIQLAYSLRKSPARLAMVLGVGTITLFSLSLLLRRGLLSLPRLERAVSQLMGCTARAVVVPHPEIATDIDTEQDLAAIGAIP